MTGTVTRWYPEKGYGFLAPDNVSRRIFVHCSRLVGGLCRNLKVGDRVEFGFTTDRSGRPVAIDVRKVAA